MKIYIVRHGETESNRLSLMQGQSESDLTDYGRSLAMETGKGLKDISFDICYASPLRRTKETANLILANSDNIQTKIIYDDRLKEINLGTWEGKTFKGSNPEINPKDVTKFFTDPFNFPNVYNGEITTDVIRRTKDFLTSLAKNNYENVLVVSHGYAIRAMLNFLYEDPTDFWQGRVPLNCAVNILDYTNNKFSFIARDKIYYDNSKAINRFTLGDD